MLGCPPPVVCPSVLRALRKRLAHSYCSLRADRVRAGWLSPAAVGNLLRDSVADLRCPVREVVRVEATEDRSLLVDEHVTDAHPGLLLGQQRAMALEEPLKKLVAAIGDRSGEIRPVLQLEKLESPARDPAKTV